MICTFLTIFSSGYTRLSCQNQHIDIILTKEINRTKCNQRQLSFQGYKKVRYGKSIATIIMFNLLFYIKNKIFFTFSGWKMFYCYTLCQNIDRNNVRLRDFQIFSYLQLSSKDFRHAFSTSPG